MFEFKFAMFYTDSNSAEQTNFLWEQRHLTVKYEDSENDNENYKPTCGKSGKGSCILFKKIVGTGSGISIIIYVCGVLAQFKFFFLFVQFPHHLLLVGKFPFKQYGGWPQVRLNFLNTKKQTTIFFVCKFSKMLCPNYITLRIQRL